MSKDCSPHVHDAVESWVSSWTQDEATHAKMRACNFGLLARSIYPDADEEAIAVMGCYHAWVFEWDDIFDQIRENTDGNALKQLQDETKRHLAYLLADPPGPKPAAMQPINSSFADIAARIVPSCSPGPRKRLLHDLVKYVDSVTGWQDRRDGSMPTLAEQYANRRLSSGIRPSICLIEYCYGLDVPSRIMKHEAIQEILERTTEIVMTTNDVVSLGPEMAAEQLSNIISVLVYQKDMNVQEAMDYTIALIQKAHVAFEAAERRLPLPTGDPEVDKDVRQLVQGCKDICTGVINWSYKSRRYHGDTPIREDGKVLVQL